MPSPYLTYGGKMKILNTGTADFIVKDKRGNSVVVEPSKTVDVLDKTAFKVARIYPFIKIIEEPKTITIEEKKSKRKKNV